MKIFFSYLRARLGIILLLLCCGAIFWMVLFFYGALLEALQYALLLSGSLLLVCGGIDYTLFYQKHRALGALQAEILYSLDAMPLARVLPDRDYQALLRLSEEERKKVMADYERERKDTADYYALWVHQIKIPISAMRLLLQSQEGPQTTLLSAELFKIEQYVEMVLSYLRLGTGSTDYVIRRCSLMEIVRQAVRKYAPLFIQKKLTLDLDDIDCSVLTDEKWLVFVLEQLLSNAIKYTKRGKIHIYLTGDKQLTIEDTGIGIAPEDLPRICEKGFTGYNGRSEKRATGLGLYLCKRVLTNLSHDISFESTVGKGTRVTLQLDSVGLKTE